MIALLQGEIAYKSIDHLILDVNGVGYRLLIPLTTYYSLPEKGAARLHVHTHVRDDAILLFGFLSAAEKEMFTLLITVSGVGPKLAVNILSHIPANELTAAIASGDIKGLSALPGIGKKTAERLILELKDKVPHAAVDGSGSGVPATAARNDALDDLISALVNLGYKENLAKKAVESLELSPDVTFENALKSALKLIGN